MNEKVRSVLSGILERFKDGSIPEVVSYAQFPIPDIPARKWSLLNRTAMFLAGTGDARGFRQWKEVHRWVKKGARAIYIIVPLTYKDEDAEGEERIVLRGFRVAPVFRVEDTEGKELEYQQLELPELPLMEVAKNWGLSVKPIPGNFSYYGYYSQSQQLIALATPEEKTFFHELAHAAHGKIITLRDGQHWAQEIVAELSAAVLCRIAGKDPKDTLGNSYRYIDRYAKEASMSPYVACVRVLKEVEQVLGLILEPALKEAA